MPKVKHFYSVLKYEKTANYYLETEQFSAGLIDCEINSLVPSTHDWTINTTASKETWPRAAIDVPVPERSLLGLSTEESY